MRLHLARLHAIDAHDVKTVRRLEHRRELSRRDRGLERRAEQPTLELRKVWSATNPAEISAGLAGLRVHRFALGELLEIRSALQLREQRFRLDACRFLRRGGGLRRDDDLLPGQRRGLRWK